MNISLEEYEAMQDRIAKLESENMFRVKQVRHLLDYVVERDELIYALRAKHPHWISTKDRLPEDYALVLAFVDDEKAELFMDYFEAKGIPVDTYDFEEGNKQ